MNSNLMAQLGLAMALVLQQSFARAGDSVALYDEHSNIACCGDVDCGETHDPCCAPRSSCAPCCKFFVGGEATFLAPDVEGLLAGASTQTFDELLGFDESTRVYNIDGLNDLSVGYRAFAGVRQGNLGLMARYWEFSPDRSDVVDGGLSFNVYAVDLEGTLNYHRGSEEFALSLGVRHAATEARVSATATTTLTTTQSAFASAGHEFDGTGITGSIHWAHALDDRSRWHLFCTLRGSALWGDQTSSFLVSADNGTVPPVTLGFADVSSETVLIGEVQAGAQGRTFLDSLGSFIFVRGAVEFQHWNLPGAVNDAISASLTFDTPDNVVAAFLDEAEAYSRVGNVRADLLGFTIAFGLER